MKEENGGERGAYCWAAYGDVSIIGLDFGHFKWHSKQSRGLRRKVTSIFQQRAVPEHDLQHGNSWVCTEKSKRGALATGIT